MKYLPVLLPYPLVNGNVDAKNKTGETSDEYPNCSVDWERIFEEQQ